MHAKLQSTVKRACGLGSSDLPNNGLVKRENTMSSASVAASLHDTSQDCGYTFNAPSSFFNVLRKRGHIHQRPPIQSCYIGGLEEASRTHTETGAENALMGNDLFQGFRRFGLLL